MTPDSAQALLDEFRVTLGMMYHTMSTMEPVIMQQVEIINVQRFTGNLMLFICFLVTMAVIVLVHLSHQRISIKKRWLAAVMSVFAVSLMLFNFLPGYLLMASGEMVKQASSGAGLETVTEQLFEENLQ